MSETSRVDRPPAIPDDPLLSRRGLLAWLGTGLFIGTSLRAGAVLAPIASPDPFAPRIPGERIRVWWPPLLDPARARVQVLRDGRPVGTAAVHPLRGRLGRFLEVEARPPPPVRPGRYDFVLTVGPVRVALGGFRIAPYRFGC